MVQAYTIIPSSEVVEQILAIDVRNLVLADQRYEDISLSVPNEAGLYSVEADE